MTKQEYEHMRNLAWLILINAKITELPIDETKLASVLFEKVDIDADKSRFENVLEISKHILKMYGYDTRYELCHALTVRLMAPMIVLKELNIKTKKELQNITDLPEKEAEKRFERYEMLLKRNKFETSNFESKVLRQFSKRRL